MYPKNMIIHHDHIKNRTKRQLIIGALAVAGVVGLIQNIISWSDTQEYKHDIEQSKIDEDHLNNLLKNQTSISDATYNLIKEDEKRTYKQMVKFQNQIETLDAKIQESVSNYVITNLAINTLMNTICKRIQDALIDITMDAHNGISNIFMMTTEYQTYL